MNGILKAIQDRRSIRAYENRQITDEQLAALLAAATQAPSANNSQPWHFSVVQNAALLEEIEQEANRVTGRSVSIFFHAPTVIFLSANPEGRYSALDCGIAVENIALAAVGLGLGSVILGRPRDAFGGEKKDEIKKLLKFPQGYELMIAIAIGFPAATKEAHPVGENKIDIIR